MMPSSTIAIRLPVGTLTRLQAMLDDHIEVLEQFLALLVSQGWLSPEVLPSNSQIKANRSVGDGGLNVALTPSSTAEQGRANQVADDFIALGKSMVDARAVADQFAEEVKKKEKEREFRVRIARESRDKRKAQKLRVSGPGSGGSSLHQSPLQRVRPRLSSLKAASRNNQFCDDLEDDCSSDESGDNDTSWEMDRGWELDKLREMQRLLVNAQNLQSHTRTNMNVQMEAMAAKQAELEARELELQNRLKESESAETRLRKELGRMERQFETSESKRLAEEEHHKSTVEKLQSKLDDVMKTQTQSIDDSVDLTNARNSSAARSSSVTKAKMKWLSLSNK
jgi:hypothetical protein